MEPDEVRKRFKRISNNRDAGQSSPTNDAAVSSSSDSDCEYQGTIAGCDMLMLNKRMKSAGKDSSTMETDEPECRSDMDVTYLETTSGNGEHQGTSNMKVNNVEDYANEVPSTVAVENVEILDADPFGNFVYPTPDAESEMMGCLSRLPSEILRKIYNLLSMEELMGVRLTNRHFNNAILDVVPSLERMRHVQIAVFTEKASTVVEEEPIITVALNIQAQNNQNYMEEREPPLQFTMSLKTAEKWLKNKTVKAVHLGSTLSNAVETFVSKTRMCAKTVVPLDTYGAELSDFNMLNTLAVKLNANHIHLHIAHRGEHVSQLKGVKELTFEYVPPSFSYLPLESQVVTLINVPSNCQRINELIKAWIAGERDIERVYGHLMGDYDAGKLEANDLNGVQYKKVEVDGNPGRLRCVYLISRPKGQLVLHFQFRSHIHIYNGSIRLGSTLIKKHFK